MLVQISPTAKVHSLFMRYGLAFLMGLPLYMDAAASGQSIPEAHEKVSPKLRRMAEAGGALPVFIVLRSQPHQEILERHESASRLKLDLLEGRYARLQGHVFVPETELREAQDDLNKALLETRQAAFKEIAAEIGPEQEDMERLLLRLGAKNIHRYSAINMLAAEIPATALETLEGEPLVLEVAPVETQSVQLAWSVPVLGAPVFWSAGYTGAGESVAVMDSGMRTSHPAFSGLNIVSRVFLDNGKERAPTCFADDPTSPEDKQGHGTHVAGIVASRGAPGWFNYWGVARGLGTLYNLKIGYLDKCTGRSSSSGADALKALDWAVQQAPAVKVFNYSYGGDTSTDDDSQARLFDYFADTYGLTISVSAGNESKSGFLGLWTNPGPVSSPGIGYNVISVAAMNTQGTVDRSDDTVAIFSSRGPTAVNRKKPDIAAPGGLRDKWVFNWLESGWQADLGIYSAAYNSDGFVPGPGTSMAAPHIAGSAALLRQAGVRDLLAIKALLLNTTDRLNWGNDQGWGYANLTRAFAQRNIVLTSTLSSSRVRLYKGAADGQFYSTLAWNRSVYQTLTGGCLSDLDLFLYNGSSGALLNSSTSSIDNVEKAYTTSYGPLVVSVTHWSQGSCRSPETFGLAFSEASFVPATGPALAASCSAPATVTPSARFTVTCTVRNSGDLPAFSVRGPLNFQGTTGGSVQDFGTIAPNASSAKSWPVTAPTSLGSFSLRAEVKSESFGAVFSAVGDLTFSTAPSTCTFTVQPTNMSIPGSGGSGTAVVTTQAGCSWQATSNASWITVTSGSTGTGSGTVGYAVAANSSTAARTGTVTIAGQSFTVTQAGTALCSYGISPTNASAPASGGTGSVAVATVPTGCSWTATSNVNWITVTSGASGTGSGAVSYTVAANTSTSSRTGTLIIAGQTFTVTQAGVGGTPVQLTAAPPSLAFTYQIGGAAPAQQTVSLASGGIPLAFTATRGTTSGGNWLVVSPTFGGTPSDLTIAVNSAVLSALAAGTYSGTVSIAAQGASNSPLTVPVTLLVGINPFLLSNPAALSFEVQPGGTTPPAKTLTVTSTGSALPFQVATTTSSGINWLAATATSATTPATLYIAVSPSGLPVGDYWGALVITATGASNSPLVVKVTLTVSQSLPKVTISSVVNGASFKPGFASSGWVTIMGTNLSRTTRIWRPDEIVGGQLPTSLDGVRANINGRPAFVYYISPTQLNVQAPTDESLYSVDGNVEVEVIAPDGSAKTTAAWKRRFAPGIFMFDPEGRRYVAAVHADGTLVGRENLIPGAPSRPAGPGDVIMLFTTGMGWSTDPAVPAGQVVTTPAALLDRVGVLVGGKPAEVAYAGLVGAGLYQINLTVPEVPDGDQAVMVQIAGVPAQDAAFITIRR